MATEKQDKARAEAEALRRGIAVLAEEWKVTQRHLRAVAAMAEKDLYVASRAERDGKCLSGHLDEGSLPDDGWLRDARERYGKLARTLRELRETARRLENLAILMQVNAKVEREEDFASEKDVAAIGKKLGPLLAGEISEEDLLPEKGKTPDETLDLAERVLKMLSLKLEIRMRALLPSDGTAPAPDGGPRVALAEKLYVQTIRHLSAISVAKDAAAHRNVLLHDAPVFQSLSKALNERLDAPSVPSEPKTPDKGREGGGDCQTENVSIPDFSGIVDDYSRLVRQLSVFQKAVDRFVANPKMPKGLDLLVEAEEEWIGQIGHAGPEDEELDRFWKRYVAAGEAGDVAEAEAVRRQIENLSQPAEGNL